jgi:hypothetical protein
MKKVEYVILIMPLVAIFSIDKEIQNEINIQPFLNISF